MVDLLKRARRRAHPGLRRRRRRDRAGEIAELQGYGVTRIYSPEDGQRMGLQGMIGEMVMRCDIDLSVHAPKALAAHPGPHRSALACARATDHRAGERQGRRRGSGRPCTPRRPRRKTPVLGITGTGGAGKSSLTDELIRRLRLDQDDALARRRDLDRPVAAQERRRAARRPHPHERDPALESTGQARLHALPGHARLRQRDQPGAARRARGRASAPAST